MGFEPNSPDNNNNQDENSNDLLQNVGWLHGFRIDSIHEPRVSAWQVASYKDGALPFVQKTNNKTSEITVTTTTRETNYVHRGWSTTAIRTISPWASSRIAAINQYDGVGTWYTRLTKTKRFKMEALLEDLTPVPEFEAAMEGALNQPTVFERFQAVYRVLGRWGDVIPLEIDVGSSTALTGEKREHVHLPEVDGHNYNNTAWLSAAKDANITVTGGGQESNDDSQTAVEPQWAIIAIKKVAPTTSLLAPDLRARLSELYAQRVSYVPPSGIGPINYWHRTYDDNNHASRTISSIKIRSSNYIELLSITYSDGVTSSNHGGGGHVGTVYEFSLAIEEYITEMLIWVEGDWVFGLQFITNMGRCSPQYGAHYGPPTVARARGGVLVGFLSHTKLHPTHKEMFTGVQGIWRHDLIPRAPKEHDVYSEYFGDRNQNGSIFNDRVMVGNSNSTHISRIKVWANEWIDSIQFTYTDNMDGQEIETSTNRRGGPGGTFHQLVLEKGEHVITVSGRQSGTQITQLCFVTSRGRTSEVFGAGKGQAFSALAPRGKNGDCFRLQYICGKSNDVSLTGVMFIWTP